MEEDDNDNCSCPSYPCNTSPKNPSRILEPSDGINGGEDSCSALIPREDDEEEIDEPEESAETELGL